MVQDPPVPVPHGAAAPERGGHGARRVPHEVRRQGARARAALQLPGREYEYQKK